MLIPLKLVRDQPLQQQLYEQLRDLIVSGRLAHGTRMPSTRMLADQFAVSRITVLLTYERLAAERYLTTVRAKGTFVSQVTAAPATPPAERGSLTEDGADAWAGRPDARLFPAGRWRALMRTALDHLGARLNADHTDGDPALRRAIARWLSSSRGLLVEQDQIILSAGRQHALHIVAHMLLRPGVQVAIEQPCDPRSERLITSTGATVIRVPVDHAGVQTDLLPDSPVAMILVTPEHQRPLGAVMSQQRRQALLAWTERSGATVVADDIDGELRYDAMDATPLMGLDPLGRVIHLGGFALSLGPGVHLGYLAVPRQMIAAARAAGRLMDDHSGQLEAAALAELLDSGGYARHLHQLRKSYLGRRDRMVEALRRRFGAATDIGGASAGLHLVWRPDPDLGHASTVAVLARRHGLDAAPLGDATILLGFGVPDEHHIETSVGGLAHALAAANQRLPPIPAISLGFSRTAARGALR
jgi:GntR family transcriptional regulator/MocR family aminotransferase